MERVQPVSKCISPPPNSPMKENQIRHSLNLAMFTGFYHGLFYWLGVYQPNKHGQKGCKMSAWSKSQT